MSPLQPVLSRTLPAVVLLAAVVLSSSGSLRGHTDLAGIATIPAGIGAQVADSAQFAPGVRVSQAQAASIDSLVKAYQGKSNAMRAQGLDKADGLTTLGRHALHEEHRQAVRAVLTADQRSRYDTWYATHLARRAQQSNQ